MFCMNSASLERELVSRSYSSDRGIAEMCRLAPRQSPRKKFATVTKLLQKYCINLCDEYYKLTL